MIRRFLGLLLLGAIPACATDHPPAPAYRSYPVIDDRGITVPLPPPSLLDSPHQEVDVEGEIVAIEGVREGDVLHVQDRLGAGVDALELGADQDTFEFAGLAIDLSHNCLEVWIVAADAREGEHREYRATIVVDDQDESIQVVEGCD